MSTYALERAEPALQTTDRFAVAWQHPVSRRISPVGLLSRAAHGYGFTYLRRATEVEGFQPFLGFPELARRYESPSLFDLFAQRVMRPSRPDYGRFVRSLGLGAESATWAVLGRSQGQRDGDGIRLFPEPSVTAEGDTGSTFFVSGLRHRLAADPDVARALAALRPGERLELRADRHNEDDNRALLVARQADVPLAWVPSLLLDYVHVAREHSEVPVHVAGVNGDDVPAGYRLLVTMTGVVPRGYEPFAGPMWATMDAPDRG